MNDGSPTPQISPKILALDTSSPNVSLAICQGQDVVAQIGVSGIAPHSRTLFRHLHYLLESAETRLDQIDLFAVVTGPGSFTGLRVGLSAIKGIAQGGKRPLIGVPAFDGWAIATGMCGWVAVLLDAGRGQVYYGLRRVDPDGLVETLGADRVMGLESVIAELGESGDVDRLIITGNIDAQRLAKTRAYIINEGDNGHNGRSIMALSPYLAQHIGALAWWRFNRRQAAAAHPYYIKPADAELMRGGGR